MRLHLGLKRSDGRKPFSRSWIISAVLHSQARLFVVRLHLLQGLHLLPGPHLLLDSLLLEDPALRGSLRLASSSVFDSAILSLRDLSRQPPSQEALFPPGDHHPSRSKATKKVHFERLRSSRSRAMLTFDLAWCSQMALSGFPQRIVASRISTRRSARPYRSSS